MSYHPVRTMQEHKQGITPTAAKQYMPSSPPPADISLLRAHHAAA